LYAFFQVNDPEEEMTAAQFFRVAYRLPAYRGAVRAFVDEYVNREHMPDSDSPVLSADELRLNPAFGARPTIGEAAPLFSVSKVPAVRGGDE
jgi:hypothetical protein